jgi:hypothetical protein
MGNKRGKEDIKMSDIYNERQQMTSTKAIINTILNDYGHKLTSNEKIGVDERQRISYLVNHWPGNDVARQILIDSIKVIIEYDLDPKNIKW